MDQKKIKKPLKKPLKKPWSILIAFVLAIFIGSMITKDTKILGISIYSILDITGILFINVLTLVVVPLVFSSIVTGVARIAGESQFSRLGSYTFLYFIFMNLVAILIGFFIATTLQPGNILESKNSLSSHAIQPLRNHTFTDVILEIIPSNILAAFAKGNMLGLIFFSLLFGYAITRISQNSLSAHMQFWKGVFEAMLKITYVIMYFLPLGVFCLTAKMFVNAGIETLKPLATFGWTVLLGLSIFSFGFVPLLLRYVAKISPLHYFRILSPAVLTAFSTSSSAATLPITLKCMEEGGRISNRICSFVIPLGISFNLAGSALYNIMTILFIEQAFGIIPSFLQQIGLILITLLISFGVASIPGGVLVASLAILHILGLPAEGLGLVLAMDRILDMFRTTVNVFSYTASTILIAKSEGEKKIFLKKLPL